MIYLDNAATTRVCAEAADAALQAMRQNFGNPSSTYRLGREAHALLDRSRASVAGALGCKSEYLYFTSCGSESDNWALRMGAAVNRRCRHIITSGTEHDAILKSAAELQRQGYEVTYLSPAPDGSIRAEDVAQALRPDTGIVSLMLVNNETGGVTDIGAIARAVHRANPQTLVHTDAVQAFMKVPFTAASLDADLISISGHKIHAPKGIGALYVRPGVRLSPFILGGSQENGRRAGTEAMPQIAAFAAAAETARAQMNEYIPRMAALKAEIISTLKDEIADISWIDSAAPHILSISLPGYRSEVLMNVLESHEIYVSKSSACKRGARSHVLEAIGMDSRSIDGAIRIGLSRETSQDDIRQFCAVLIEAAHTLRRAL